MLRSKRFINTILIMVGMIGMSSFLTQCAVGPAALPIPGTPTGEITERKPLVNSVASEVLTTAPTPTVPRPSLTPDAPILPPGGPGAATNLLSEVECEEPRKAIAKLTWTVATNRGTAQRVDVTIFKDGFTMGEYETSELLPPDQSSLLWEDVSPGLNHRWRVLTLQAEGWVPSETMIFKGPVCVGDEEEESTPPPIP